MLYRAVGHVLFVLPCGRGPTVIRSRPDPRRPRRRRRAPPVRPAAADPGVPPVGAKGPRPGVDTRIWDHDGPALFSNVYRLGHRSTFSWAKLLAALPPRPRPAGPTRP